MRVADAGAGLRLSAAGARDTGTVGGAESGLFNAKFAKDTKHAKQGFNLPLRSWRPWRSLC
jgi:hypothetical protein